MTKIQRLGDVSDQLETEYGATILEELTHQSLTRKGQAVRLFDQSTKSAEAYYPADERGKPYVQNHQEGKRWYPINAWMQAYDVDWKTAVQQLAKRYLGDTLPVRKQSSQARAQSSILSTPKPAVSYHDPALMKTTLGNYDKNNLVIYLRRLLGTPVSDELLTLYKIGTCLPSIAAEWERSTVFWQIDQQDRIHSGKVIFYSAVTGKRSRDKKSDFSRPFWLHDVMALRDFNLEQCFFGLHQLHDLQDTRPIAIVESEKTALISTAFEPGFIWLACGGLSQLNAQKCKPLLGRQIVLFPDLGGYRLWTQKAEELQRSGHTVTVSKVLEETATNQQRHEGLDIADFLTRHQCPLTRRVLNEADGYPALWDCQPINPEPQLTPISLADYLALSPNQ